MVAQCFGAAIMICMVRHLSETLPSPVIVFFRNLFGLMSLLPWFIFYGRRMIHKPRWKLYLARGGFGLVAMQMWFYALSVVPVTLATALSFTSPLISALLAVWVFKEKGSISLWLSLLVGFGGVLVILRPGTEAFDWNVMWVMATAAMWSVSGLIIKSLTRTQTPLAVVFFMGLVMTPLSLLFLPLDWQMPQGVEWVWLLGLGVVSNLFQIALSYALSKTDIVHIMPYDFTRLVFVSLIAFYFFHETPDHWTLIGSVIIVASAVAASRYESRKARRMATNAQLKP